MKEEVNSPKASSLSQSMRGFGYTLETALADIVDNSVTAEAQHVGIFLDASGEAPSIAIVDDGNGMDADELRAAMRPGSKNPLDLRGSDDLGRFGLGLKTASFALCRQLTVVTRKDGLTSAARWDLNLVEERDQWILQILEKEDIDQLPHIHELSSRGTLVLWQDLDRLEDSTSGSQLKNHLYEKMDDALEHLELVFHRFLSGEKPYRRMRIAINGRDLEGFDPFNSKHPATSRLREEVIRVGDQTVRVQAFVLPHHKKVSPADWKKYGGKAGYLKSQGFYLYRAGRLILHGTWFRLAKQSELTRLARVRIDIPNGMDELWKINVMKAFARPPFVVRERLKRLIDELSGPAHRVYTARGRRLTDTPAKPFWIRSVDKNEFRYEINPDHPTISVFIDQIGPSNESGMRSVLKAIERSLPMATIFSDLAGQPNAISQDEFPTDQLRETLRISWEWMKERGNSDDEIRSLLTTAEPFASNLDTTLEILDELREESTE